MASRKKKTTNITVITCTGGWISSTADLKAYFLHRKAISLVVQLRIEQAHAGGVLKPERAVLLREALAELYRAGLGERYVPTEEQARIAGSSV